MTWSRAPLSGRIVSLPSPAISPHHLVLQLTAQYDTTGKCATTKAAVATFEAASAAAFAVLQRDVFPVFLRSEQVSMCGHHIRPSFFPSPSFLHLLR
jgi:hypothetical protein